MNKRQHNGFVIEGPDEPGSLSLFGNDPVEHRAFAEQIVAEAYNTEKMRYEDVKGYRHNHWLDCMAGCCLAAEILGIKLISDRTEYMNANPTNDGQVARHGNRKMRRNY